MLYREAGQFKTTYAADQQLFPLRQDRIGLIALLAVAFFGVPLFASEYWFSAILIPFLIFSLAALGLNILTGYAGQLSLGTAAFMAVGAYAAYNFQLRIEGIPILVSFIGAGLVAAGVGILFGLPSLRIKGFYLAVATLAAQFFIVWCLTKFPWLSNNSSSGVISAQNIEILGFAFNTPVSKYLLVLAIVVVMALAANLASVALLLRYKDGDANVRSVWLCSRNDLASNAGVILAAGVVAMTGSAWPDAVVGALVAMLFLHSSLQVLREAWPGWRKKLGQRERG